MSDFRDHIAVIDYGMGNLHSVAKALEHVAPSALVSVTSDPQVVENADRVVFPGVGAIRDCMHEIQRLNIGEVVKKAIQTKPVLAICVGMQALMESSEENSGINCLNIMPGQVKYFGDNLVDSHGNKLKVPHMGWNRLNHTAGGASHTLLRDVPDGAHVYFVHGFRVPAVPDMIASCTYGGEFTALVAKDNFMGAQFHPERSGLVGAQILQNFIDL